MEMKPRAQRGYHLTVTGDAKVSVRHPIAKDRKDPNFGEFKEFLCTVSKIMIEHGGSTTRGRLFIGMRDLRISMYNCNKTVCTSFNMNRETKELTVTKTYKPL